MAVEDADLRAYFFNTDEFGQSATVTPSGGSATSINVIFDKPDETLTLGEAGITSHRPRITCRESDISNVVFGDSVVVNSTNYTVAEILKDGTGIAEVYLEETV